MMCLRSSSTMREAAQRSTKAVSCRPISCAQRHESVWIDALSHSIVHQCKTPALRRGFGRRGQVPLARSIMITLRDKGVTDSPVVTNALMVTNAHRPRHPCGRLVGLSVRCFLKLASEAISRHRVQSLDMSVVGASAGVSSVLTTFVGRVEKVTAYLPRSFS